MIADLEGARVDLRQAVAGPTAPPDAVGPPIDRAQCGEFQGRYSSSVKGCRCAACDDV